MIFEKRLFDKPNSRNLLIQTERTLFNVDEQANAPVESVTFSQLTQLPVHFYFASQYYGQCTVNICKDVPPAVEQVNTLLVLSHCADVTINIDDDVLAKDVEVLLKEYLEPSLLRYLILKKKRVGEK